MGVVFDFIWSTNSGEPVFSKVA